MKISSFVASSNLEQVLIFSICLWNLCCAFLLMFFVSWCWHCNMFCTVLSSSVQNGQHPCGCRVHCCIIPYFIIRIVTSVTHCNCSVNLNVLGHQAHVCHCLPLVYLNCAVAFCLYVIWFNYHSCGDK